MAEVLPSKKDRLGNIVVQGDVVVCLKDHATYVGVVTGFTPQQYRVLDREGAYPKNFWDCEVIRLTEDMLVNRHNKPALEKLKVEAQVWIAKDKPLPGTKKSKGNIKI